MMMVVVVMMVVDMSSFLAPSTIQIYYLCIEQYDELGERHGKAHYGGLLRHSPARTYVIKE